MFLARGEEGEQDSDVLETLGRLNIGSAEGNNNQEEEEEDSGNKEEVKVDTTGEMKDKEQPNDKEITEDGTEVNTDAIKVLLFYVEMVPPVDNSEEEDEPEEAILQLDDLRTAAPRILLKYLESRLSLESDTCEEEDLGII